MKLFRGLDLNSVLKTVLLICVSALLAATLSSCSEATSTGITTVRSNSSRPADELPPLRATGDPGLLLLLVPEGQLLTSPQVTAWIDAASEEGVRLRPVTDGQFMSLGLNALKYAGLILPDQLHPIASDELLQAVRDYTIAGGRTLVVYDFGVFSLDNNQKPTYPIPKSRLSDLVGVDYALYDALREKTTVMGPVTAMRSTMRHLQVPPGKSIAYVASKNSGPGATTAAAAVVGSAGPDLTPVYAAQSSLPLPARGMSRGAATPVDMLDTYSGYLLGNLEYSSFVTRGAFSGTTLATSPVAGLIAGLHTVGRGQVLFVNLPLTYLKVIRTDALPLHGFLHYFAFEVLQLAYLSPVPDAVAGLTLNWHLDSFTAQQPLLRLEKLGVFDHGPFSIDMTAGPDAVTVGDGKGWNLDNNPVAQHILKRFSAKGHIIGSHGGWNHDYYGLNANENNRATFLSYLELNMKSVQRAVRGSLPAHRGSTIPTTSVVASSFDAFLLALQSPLDWLFGSSLREYSPPVGNNPSWAMDWLEQKGVVAAYFAGHTGLGPTRQYRDGQLRNPGMWIFPVTPAGKYATFEEFEVNQVAKQEVMDWCRDLVDFAVSHNTTRMIYMHPNGANVWLDVLQDLLGYAQSQGSERFKWYTMTRLADFMATRLAVTWTERLDAAGLSQFELSHPSSLKEMVWMLPKTRYATVPVSEDGSVTVSDQGAHWAVRAGNTRKARFTASSLAGFDAMTGVPRM